jgi:hypothetical protein
LLAVAAIVVFSPNCFSVVKWLRSLRTSAIKTKGARIIINVQTRILSYLLKYVMYLFTIL